MRTTLRDVGFALRMLRRSPGFTFIAVLTIALGIGAVSAVFSLVNAVLLDGLPFERADRLVFIRGVRMVDTPQQFPLGYQDIDALRAADMSLETLSPVTGSRPYNLKAGAEIEHVMGEMVGPDYFRVLRAGLALGRTFSGEEAAPATAQPVVVLSHALWRARFGSDPAVLDKTLELSDRVYRVIGVAEPGFRGLSDEAQVWLPIGMAGPIYGRHYTDVREFRWLSAVARMRDNASLEQVRETVETIGAQLRAAFPKENNRLGFSVNPLDAVMLGSLRTPLLVLLAAAAFVLLIACVNVSNMLLARGHARALELSLRRALGADAGRLFGQLLTEAVVLCAAGAAGGLALAYLLPKAAIAWAPPEMQSFITVTLDPLVIAFAVVCTGVAAVLAGVAPSMLLLRQQTVSLLREGGRSAGGRTRHRFQRALVVAEVSLGLALLIGAAAMARGFGHFLSADLGMRTASVLSVRLDLIADTFKQNERYWATAREVLARTKAVSGVADAALEGPGFPTSGSYAISFRKAGGDPTDPDIGGLRHHVTPGYFQALGIPLRAGRDFGPQDVPGGERALIVSQTFADRTWPGRNPLGERLTAGAAPDAPVVVVVGVVADVRHSGRTDAQAWAPDVYISLFQSPARSPATLTVYAKSHGHPDLIASAVQAAVRDASGLPPYDVESLDERLDQQTSSARFAVLVVSAFAVAALLLAVSGVYGVVSYIVGQRTREIGIRLALGSGRLEVLYLMLRIGLTPVAAGVVMGVLIALWSGQYMTSVLYGLQATDPVHVFTMGTLLLAVATVATLVPAVRATRVPPSIALRSE